MAAAHAGAPEQRQRDLRNLLEHDCGSCHGTRLLGGLGPPLTPQAMRRFPQEYIAAVILDGRRGTAMPPWRGILDPADAAWLASVLVNGDTP